MAPRLTLCLLVICFGVAAWPAGAVSAEDKPQARVRLLTLNIAHGRRSAGLKASVAPETVQANLAAVAAFLREQDADLVALQEVDAASTWTNSVDQLEYLAEAAGYPYRYHGIHFDAAMGPLRMAYGTGLLSRLELRDTVSWVLPGSSWHSKGAVAAAIEINGQPVTVVSVHLDSGDSASRMRQVDALVALISKRNRPWVILGDLNSTWADESDAVRRMCEELGVRPARSDSERRPTYPASSPHKSIDWILVSPEIEVLRAEVLAEAVSDHLAVSAVVR